MERRKERDIEREVEIQIEGIGIGIWIEEGEIENDCCPNCFTAGYYQENLYKLDDSTTSNSCTSCNIVLCKLCAYRGFEEKTCFYCWNCQSKFINNNNKLKDKINGKIRDSKFRDSKDQVLGPKRFPDQEPYNEREYITCQDVINMIITQESKCCSCEEIFLCSNWKRFCCYQFSITKIDSSKCRNKDNFRLSCYYCACKHRLEFDQPTKKCKSGCHQ